MDSKGKELHLITNWFHLNVEEFSRDIQITFLFNNIYRVLPYSLS